MSQRFTTRAQRVILLAQEESRRLHHDYVGPEHLLLGILALGEGVAAQVLANMGADSRRMRLEIEDIAGTGEAVLQGEIPFTPRAKKTLELTVEESQHFGHFYVGTEHLLLGLIREEEGAAARVLRNSKVGLEAVRAEILNLLGGDRREPLPCAAEPSESTDLGRQLLAISKTPEVRGILLAPGSGDAPTIIILLKEGATPDSAYLSLAPVLPASDRLRFKEPGKTPVAWSNGDWKEDTEFGPTLTF